MMQRNSIFLFVVTGMVVLSCSTRPSTDPGTRPNIGFTMTDDQFLELVQRRAFEFFWDGYDENTGIMVEASRISAPGPDHWINKMGSITSVGFGLSAYCIAEARGWVEKEEVYRRVLKTLNSFYQDPDHEDDFCVGGTHGFFYHFVDIKSGDRFNGWEVSTTGNAILMAGILHVMQHFKGTEIGALAKKIYLAAEWDWFLNPNGAVSAGWLPENGIFGEYKGYNEYTLVYLLGLGSPTHPIPESSWDAWSSGPGFQWVEPYENIGAFLTPDGKMTPMAYLYQFPACWIDFREKEDKYGIDYWGMGVNALQANRRLCIDWGEENDYHPDLWGWTACNGKNGYLGWGVPYNGTIAPSAAVASLPYMPEESLRSVKYMYDHHQLAWSKYGFVDAFDPGQAWYDNAFLGIDKGNEVLMIENYRNEGVWLELMKNPYVVAGMQKAGFIK